MTIQRRTFLGLLSLRQPRRKPPESRSTWTSTGHEVEWRGLGVRQAMAGMNAAAAPPASPIQPVFTRSGSNLRHGVYGHETRLTPAVVRGGLNKLFTLTMTGDKRGMEAQPLFAPAIRAKDGRCTISASAARWQTRYGPSMRITANRFGR